MRISVQFFLSILLILGVTFYYVADAVNAELKPRYREAVEENLADSAHILALVLAEQAGAAGRLDPDLLKRVFEQSKQVRLRAKIYELEKTGVDLRLSITDDAGIVLYDSFTPENVGKNFSQWRDVMLSLQGEYGARTTRDISEDATSTVLYVSSPVVIHEHIAGVVTVAKPTQSSNVFIRLAQRRLFRASAILLCLILILSSLMVVFVTRPIRKLTAYARAIRDGKPAELPRIGSSDLNDLAEAFQEMREALEGKQYIERYVQTLTHELKSPIAGIRGAAELLREDALPPDRRQQFLQNITSETERIQNIIERLLELAAVEKQERIEDKETIDLASMLRDVVDALAPRIEKKKLHIVWGMPEPVLIDGDPFLLRQSLRNVIDNAIDFSPNKGEIRIALQPVRTDGTDAAQIIVEDTGPGIPAYAVDRVFERFFSLPRVDTGRKGSGLGLTFVAEVMKLHHGTIRVQNRPDVGLMESQSGRYVKGEQGALVTIVLPKKLNRSAGKLRA